MMRFIARVAAVGLSALFVAGCVESSGPLLKNARPLFGEQLRLQFYTLRHGVADEPEEASYKWDGARYAHASGRMEDVNAFTVHQVAGDILIVQSFSTRRPQIVEYAVARKLTDGVYQVAGIDEDDAPRLVRARLCRRKDDSHCRIETRTALLEFARATARQRKGQGGLVLHLADQPSR